MEITEVQMKSSVEAKKVGRSALDLENLHKVLSRSSFSGSHDHGFRQIAVLLIDANTGQVLGVGKRLFSLKANQKNAWIEVITKFEQNKLKIINLKVTSPDGLSQTAYLNLERQVQSLVHQAQSS